MAPPTRPASLDRCVGQQPYVVFFGRDAARDAAVERYRDKFRFALHGAEDVGQLHSSCALDVRPPQVLRTRTRHADEEVPMISEDAECFGMSFPLTLHLGEMGVRLSYANANVRFGSASDERTPDVHGFRSWPVPDRGHDDETGRLQQRTPRVDVQVSSALRVMCVLPFVWRPVAIESGGRIRLFACSSAAGCRGSRPGVAAYQEAGAGACRY